MSFHKFILKITSEKDDVTCSHFNFSGNIEIAKKSNKLVENILEN